MQRAWDACPLGCKPIVIGDFNINFGFPRDEREEVIVDLLDKINLIDTSCRFQLRTPWRASTRARWTWSRKRQWIRHYTQPDYFMACTGEMAHFRGVGFRSPRYLHLDHRAIVANIWAGRTGRLKKYRRSCQKFPLSLPPGQKDTNTALFEETSSRVRRLQTNLGAGKELDKQGDMEADCQTRLPHAQREN